MYVNQELGYAHRAPLCISSLRGRHVFRASRSRCRPLRVDRIAEKMRAQLLHSDMPEAALSAFDSVAAGMRRLL